MTENELSKILVNLFFHIHKDLGPGLFESIYEEILCHELRSKEITYQRQVGLPVTWKGRDMDLGFRADIIVEGKVIIEIKSIDNLSQVHRKQILTYLRLTNIKLGLLVNFNEALIKDGIYRLVNNL